MGSDKTAGKGAATRAAILDTTAQLIVEKGVDGFTMSEIAVRARVNRALIYHYFRTRDNLLVEAIGHIMKEYGDVEPAEGVPTIERNIRMHIAHPEIARFFYQLLLSDRPLPSLWRRLTSAIERLEAYAEQHGQAQAFDVPFIVIMVALSQLSWPIWRHDFARLLGLRVEEADERFVASMVWVSELGLRALGGGERSS